MTPPTDDKRVKEALEVPSDEELGRLYDAEYERKPCFKNHGHLGLNQTVELMKQVRDRTREAVAAEYVQHRVARVNQLVAHFEAELKQARAEAFRELADEWELLSNPLLWEAAKELRRAAEEVEKAQK